METGLSLATGTGQAQAVAAGQADDALVEEIWREMQGTVSRTQIHQMVTEARTEFAQATITLYVPIFVRRQVRERLAVILSDEETAHVKQSIHPTAVVHPDGGDRCSTTIGQFATV
jgi:hypothetical protein